MAGKRIDKKFVLSDSSVNCYGFRLLTSGYQLAAYAVNPIGYYMHLRDKGVVVRWDNLAIEGDQVTGYPIINLSNERGQQTLDEVESGFLNAASVGDIIVLEYSVEPEMMLAGQTGPTITKWTNKEVSLVDVPGNEHALTRLFDAKDNPINIADLPGLAHIPQLVLEKNTDNMKEVKLPITAGLLKALAFDASATPTADEINGAVENLSARVNTLTAENTTLKADKTRLEGDVKSLKDSATKTEVEAMLAAGMAEKKMPKALCDKLAADYADNPAKLKEVIDAMPKHQSISEHLRRGGTTNNYDGKTWDDLHKEGKLSDLKASNPERYAELFKDKYGKEPKL